MRSTLRALLAIVPLLAGCATAETRNAVPGAELALRARLANLPEVRSWGDEMPADLVAEVRRRMPGLPKLGQHAERVGGRPVVHLLALSGGGSDGAFGAGLLAGWTRRGDRPEFELVSGVSAGAIIAPFAFLGPAYDDRLREVWTQYRTDQIATAQILPGLLGGPALADTAPLAALIARYVDRAMLDEIARQYARGRILLVGTTNLDAQRPVVWNMGAIAVSSHPHALELFRAVILASASIPGAFPPVSIPVEVDGKVYEEMHVDGGTTREVFLTPVQLDFKAFDPLYVAPPIRKIYIVKNGKVAPEYKPVARQAIPIAGRAIHTLIRAQHLGDVYRVYRKARDAGADFNLMFVPDTFKAEAKEAFDPRYQKALFEEGFRLGLAGGPWAKAPPDVPPPRRR
jgi:predicted acylesterase/phospholipase RssA